MAQRTVAAPGSSARVFNSFVRHNPVNNSMAKGLADALGVVMKTAQPLVKEYNEEELKKGLAARTTGILEDGRKIRNGEMPKDQSEHWMRGFKIGEGRFLANQAEQEIMTLWETSAIQNSTDPEAFQTWMQDNMKQVLGKHGQITDPYVRQGLMESLSSMHKNISGLQTTAMRKQLDSQTQDHLSAEVTHMFSSMTAGAGPFQNLPAAKMIPALQAEVSAIVEGFVHEGLTPDQARDAAYEAWKAEAVKRTTRFGVNARGEIDAGALTADAFLDAFPKSQRSSDINKVFEADKLAIRKAAFDNAGKHLKLFDQRTETHASDFVLKAVADPAWVNSPEAEDIYTALIARDKDLATTIKTLIEGGSNDFITAPDSTEQKAKAHVKSLIDNKAFEGKSPEAIIITHMRNGRIQRKETIAELFEYARDATKTEAWMDHDLLKEGQRQLYGYFGFGDIGKINSAFIALDQNAKIKLEAELKPEWRAARRKIVNEWLHLKSQKGNEDIAFSSKYVEPIIQAEVKRIQQKYEQMLNPQGTGTNSVTTTSVPQAQQQWQSLATPPPRRP